MMKRTGKQALAVLFLLGLLGGLCACSVPASLTTSAISELLDGSFYKTHTVAAKINGYRIQYKEDIEDLAEVLQLEDWQALFPWQTEEVPDSEEQLMTVYLGDDYELYLYEGCALACYTGADAEETETAYYSFSEEVTEGLKTYLDEDFGTRLIFPEDTSVTASESYLLLGDKEQVYLSKLGHKFGWGESVKLYDEDRKRVNFEELLTDTKAAFSIQIEANKYFLKNPRKEKKAEVIELNDGWEGYLYDGEYDLSTAETPGETGDYYVLVVGQEGSRDCFYLWLQDYTTTEVERGTGDDGGNWVHEYFHEGDEAYVSYEEMKAFAESLYIKS